ncbi:MAG: carbohydrate ABC transporter permease [Candidatus Hydrogenedentota bacterium]
MAEYYKSLKTQEILKKIFSYLFLIAGSILMLAPIVWTISTSLKEEGSTQTLPPEWTPRVMLRVMYNGKLLQVMQSKSTGEIYLLIKKEKEGYTVRKIKSQLNVSYFSLIRETEKMEFRLVKDKSRSLGKTYLIIQDFETTDSRAISIAQLDELKSLTGGIPDKFTVLTVKPLPVFELDNETVSDPLDLKPKKVMWFRWRNYKEAWGVAPFGRMYINSIMVSLAITFGVLFTSSLAAYSFARINFPGRDKLFLLYLGTMMIPFPVTMIPTFIIIEKLGWMDTFYALIVPGLFSTYGVFMLRQFFMTIPKELEEAAIIDGCSRFGIYWRIFLPLSLPALATLGIFTFIGTYNDFMGPLIYLKTESKYTLPVGLSYFQGQYHSQTAYMMAASMIVLAPMIIVYVFGQRFFVRGIVMTGLKG